ncbi:hypothetical protein SDC9_104303 [bioreactor metagenome]|uniref:Uncharacterized protein n=1 Tax=bioreactor metagenome TaxID=1076179 RepID=A0A645AYT3_9ZZZZ
MYKDCIGKTTIATKIAQNLLIVNRLNVLLNLVIAM